MKRNYTGLSRRDFLRQTASIVTLASVGPAATKHVLAQSAGRSRITVAHGVGVYSLNPYAVNTSPLQAVWGSIMEPMIDADYEKRGYRGVLAESWQMKGPKLQFNLRKNVRFHDGAALAQDTPAPQQPAATTPAAPPAARGRGTPAPTRDPQTPGFVAATMRAPRGPARVRRAGAVRPPARRGRVTRSGPGTPP